VLGLCLVHVNQLTYLILFCYFAYFVYFADFAYFVYLYQFYDGGNNASLWARGSLVVP